MVIATDAAIVTLVGVVDAEPVLSVTVTTKPLIVPATVGLPLIEPVAVLKDSPPKSVPDDSVKALVPLPFAVVGVKL